MANAGPDTNKAQVRLLLCGIRIPFESLIEVELTSRTSWHYVHQERTTIPYFTVISRDS